MGNKNSVSNENEQFITSIQDTIISALQEVSNKTMINQTTNFNCTDREEMAKLQARCHEQVIHNYGKDGKVPSVEEVKRACNDFYQCSVNNLELTQSIIINLDNNLTNQAIEIAQSNIGDAINSTAKQQSGLMTFGTDTRNTIKTEITNIQRSVSNITQSVNEQGTYNQSVSFTGNRFTIELVKIDQAVDIVRNYILKNKSLENSISNIVNSIQSDVSSRNQSLSQIADILKVGILIFMLCIISFGVILVVLKNM